MLPLRETVQTSRPLLWLNTAALWVVALIALDQSPTRIDLLLILYFTLPFNLWLHGINDIHDYESDLLNPRKGGAEGALLRAAQRPALWRTILLWNVPFWLLLLPLGEWQALLLIALFLALGWAYSAPPIRAKSRPVLDTLFNVAYLMPLLIALTWHGAPPTLWLTLLPAMVAFAVWNMASHAFTAIQDIDADRCAALNTIATYLGARGAAWLALTCYLGAVVLVAHYGLPWPLLLIGYPLLVVRYLAGPSRDRAHHLYREFIALNLTVGLLLSSLLVVPHLAERWWVAPVMLALVGVVTLALTVATPRAAKGTGWWGDLAKKRQEILGRGSP